MILRVEAALVRKDGGVGEVAFGILVLIISRVHEYVTERATRGLVADKCHRRNGGVM